jgi:hypothetical protein
VDGEVCGTPVELEEASAGPEVDRSDLSAVGLLTDEEEGDEWSGVSFRWSSMLRWR